MHTFGIVDLYIIGIGYAIMFIAMKTIWYVFVLHHIIMNYTYCLFERVISYDKAGDAYSVHKFISLIKEICATNAQNRDKQESTHRGGAMPFIQHALRAVKIIKC